MPASIELYTIQLPGHETRRNEILVRNLPSLIDALGPVFRDYIDIPFSIFGHSMGALLGFELVRYLRTNLGVLPLHLFVSGHRAPQLPDRRPSIHTLSDSAFIARLAEWKGTPDEVLENRELMELFLPILRADFELCETYVYSVEPPLDCPISAFGGYQDERVGREELADWAAQTAVSFKLQVFPGGHFFFNSVRPLFLKVLSQRLDEDCWHLSPRDH